MTLFLSEAGQGLPRPVALHTHQLTLGTDFTRGAARAALLCGHRALQKWIPLMAALHTADAAGELVAPDLSCLDVPDAPVGVDLP